MMSLVAYDDETESENEEDDESGGKVTINEVAKQPAVTNEIVSMNSNSDIFDSADGLFTKLPQPKSRDSIDVEEEQDEFLEKKEEPAEKPKKKRQPVKIGIAALSEFQRDEESEEPVKKKSKMKASGLFAVLPEPKNVPLSNTSFVPNVLKKKLNPTLPPKPSPVKPETSKAKPVQKEAEDEDDLDIDIPDTFDDETWQQVCGKQKRPAKQSIKEEPVFQPIVVELAPEVQQPYTGLDNQAFKELLGSRKKLKEDIKIIEINEDEIRADKAEWLKSLTDPNYEGQESTKGSNKNNVNPTEKTKNHITALAAKALANDKELQVRWAEERHHRKMNQAKYGF